MNHATSSTSSRPCQHCGSSDIDRPPPSATALLAAAYVYAGVSVVGASLLGPAILMILPFLVVGGMSAVTAAHQLADRMPHCRACGRYAPIPSDTSEPAPPSEACRAA